VAYTIQFADAVKTYFREKLTGLSRSASVKLFAQAIGNLADHGDEFRSNPSLRLHEGSPHFRFELIVADVEGDGRIHSFLFIVSDAAAQYGVLQIVYVEHTGQTQLEP
jgi:hypothetical protein